MRPVIKRIINSLKQNPNSNLNINFKPAIKTQKRKCCGGK